jgi:hypothetical protein
MQLRWVEVEYEVFDGTIGRACIDIVALFLLPHTAFSAHQVVTLHSWAGFRQFSVNQLIEMLQDRTLKLRRQNAKDHLKLLANKTFHSGQLKAIEAALKLLASEQGLPLDSEALTMLYTMADVFKLPGEDVSKLVDRYFV